MLKLKLRNASFCLLDGSSRINSYSWGARFVVLIHRTTRARARTHACTHKKAPKKPQQRWNKNPILKSCLLRRNRIKYFITLPAAFYSVSRGRKTRLRFDQSEAPNTCVRSKVGVVWHQRGVAEQEIRIAASEISARAQLVGLCWVELDTHTHTRVLQTRCLLQCFPTLGVIWRFVWENLLERV